MMARFLDSLRIVHIDCRLYDSADLTRSKSELEQAVAILLLEFPHEDVALYTQILNCQKATFASEMHKIDFSEIENSLQNLKAGLPALSADSSQMPLASHQAISKKR